MKIVFKIIGISLAILVGFNAIIHIVLTIPFSLVLSKPDDIQNRSIWNIFFLLHVFFGGIALTSGWYLFLKKLQNKWRKAHKMLGYIYALSTLISAISGFYIAFYANGGWVASLGFISLTTIWFYVTLNSIFHVRNGLLKKHQEMMIYSYALCLSAVTFRLWNPALNLLLNDEILAYQVAAWESWLPNIFVAFLIIRNKVDKT